MGLWQNIKDALVKSSKEGIYLPVMHDASTAKASATLFFMYIANLLAIVSLIWLHFQNDAFVATVTTAIYSVVWTVLYMMRRIQKAKFDLDDKEFELEGEDEEEPAKPADGSNGN
jgi:hypothetical protein